MAASQRRVHHEGTGPRLNEWSAVGATHQLSNGGKSLWQRTKCRTKYEGGGCK